MVQSDVADCSRPNCYFADVLGLVFVKVVCMLAYYLGLLSIVSSHMVPMYLVLCSKMINDNFFLQSTLRSAANLGLQSCPNAPSAVITGCRRRTNECLPCSQASSFVQFSRLRNEIGLCYVSRLCHC